MTKRQLAKIYAEACVGAMRNPNEDGYDLWEKHLGTLEESELRAALDLWQVDMTEVIVFGETTMRGSTMPSHLDMLKLVMREKNKRRADGPFVPCGIDGCTNGRRLEYRETKIYGKSQMVRVAAECSCLKAWAQGNRPAHVPPTLDADLILLKSLRRVQ